MSEVVDFSPCSLDSSLWMFLPAIFISACASSSAAFRVMLFSGSVMSNSLRSHGLQASLSFTISQSLLKLMSIKSVTPSNHPVFCRPLLLVLSIFPASGSFLKSHFFASGGQSVGGSASASVLPVNIQDWFPLGWLGWVALLHVLSLPTPPRTQVPAGEPRGLALCVLTE